MKRKITGIVVMLMMVCIANQPIKAYQAQDWQTDNGAYGTVTKVDDNITNVKGSTEVDEYGRNVGPFTKAKMKSFSDTNNVVDMEVHVKIDLDAMQTGDRFWTTAAMNDQNGEYATELRMKFVKKENGSVEVSPEVTIDDSFSYEIKETGIYTLRWEFKKGTQFVSCNFLLKQKDTVLLNGLVPNMDVIMGSRPSIETLKSGRYLWFHDIKVAGGLYVYENLVSDVYQPPVIDGDTTLDKDKISDTIISSDKQAKVEVQIIPGVDKVALPKEAINEANKLGKELAVEVKDESGKTSYTWFFNGTIEKDVNLVLNRVDVKNDKDIKAVVEDGMVLDFNHSGVLPTGTKVKVDVSQAYQAGDKVKVSYFDEVNKTLSETKEYTVDVDGTILVEISHCSKYVVEKVVNQLPSEPNTPTTPEKPDVSKPEVNQPTAPKTGDTTNVAGLSLVLLACGGLIVYGVYRKAKTNKE